MTLCYKMQQIFITKSDNSLLQNASVFLSQNVRVLLQNATVIKKCVDFIQNSNYYKMQHLLKLVSLH